MKKQIIKIVLVLVLALFGRGVGAEEVATVSLTIRDEANIVFSGTVALPTAVTSLNDSDGAPHTLDASSLLSVLASADETSDDFIISNLQYFSSFGSLYLKCITDVSGEKCDNWQYTVNDTYPGAGMDQNILTGGENVYVYFGPQNRVSLNNDSLTTNETLTATTEAYDYENDQWVPRTGVTIGLTQPNPSDAFNPTEISTSPVDAEGKATFSNIAVGDYHVGVKEDFYFPTETLTVSAGATSSGGGGGNRKNQTETAGEVLGATNIKFDLAKALNFIVSKQKNNGSFEEDLYTDWAALALAPANHQTEVLKLIKYLQESKIESTLLTDYERRAMALLSLGLNPYNTNGINYIEKITASFDGKQFGDPHENNDDVFALIVLQNAGFTPDNKMLNLDVDFILSAQGTNGSWNESVDMTGATIEALAQFSLRSEVKSALEKAKNYLKEKQKANGGWNDSASSTAWALEGILALGEKPEDWQKKTKTPFDYLATLQDTDGGIKNEYPQNKLWETAYVASALSGKTWNQIMQKFSKHEMEVVPLIVKAPTKKPTVKKADVNLTTAAIESLTPTPEPKIPQTGWFFKLLQMIF